MIVPKRLTQEIERTVEELFGLRILALGAEKQTQISQDRSKVRMVRSQFFLAGIEGLPQQGFGFAIAAHRHIQLAQVVPDSMEVRAIGCRGLLPDSKGTKVERLGLGEAALILVKGGEVVPAG